MARDIELEKLRRELAAGKEKVEQAEAKAEIQLEKTQIRKQLILLKHPKKIALAKRFGRGFKVTGKKVGTALIKQARLIEAQQERDRRLDVARERMLSRPVKVRKGKKKKSSREKEFNPFALDF